MLARRAMVRQLDANGGGDANFLDGQTVVLMPAISLSFELPSIRRRKQLRAERGARAEPHRHLACPVSNDRHAIGREEEPCPAPSASEASSAGKRSAFSTI